MDSFKIFINKNGFNFNDPNSEQLNKLIKYYIIENKLKEDNIIILLNNIKLELSESYNKNITNNTQINNTDKLNKIESYENDYKNDNYEQYENFSNYSESDIKTSILKSLFNNDINTWLFIGIIFISFIIVTMIIIHKK